MMSMVNKSLRSGDTSLSEAKYVIDCHSDIISSRDHSSFTKCHSDLQEVRAGITAKLQSPLGALQAASAASDYKKNAKGLHQYAQDLANEAMDSRVISAGYGKAHDDLAAARAVRTLLEEGYNVAPISPKWAYDDVAYTPITSRQTSGVVGLDPRRERRKTYRA